MSVKEDGGALIAEFTATGAKLRIDPWNGEVLTASLVPEGRFAAVVANLGPQPIAFVQFQIDKDGKLNLFKLSMDDGQAYEFRRE